MRTLDPEHARRCADRTRSLSADYAARWGADQATAAMIDRLRLIAHARRLMRDDPAHGRLVFAVEGESRIRRACEEAPDERYVAAVATVIRDVIDDLNEGLIP